ncbi:MAG: 3-phosphoserine/phosphohydroxythreonine transaminase [Candidatus Thorarchaeota archaeon]|nr:3-phosphoserine/phosphohydroxythreonine transaminase [Candidatus Thorarchaeota archaeon]
MTKRAHNFNPGPAAIPLPALKKAQEEFLDFAGTGMSILEVSHRSKEYEKVHYAATDLLRELLRVPSDYKILWLQGGASTQFFMVPMNLQVQGKPMEYVITGGWAEKALTEAKLFGETRIVATSKDQKYTFIPEEVRFNAGAAFGHITSNNTLYGTEWPYWPTVPEDVPLVCDMSSDFMARVVDVKKFGVIYAGAQKNLGPAGVTVVIVREDLLGRAPENIPTMCKWRTHAKDDAPSLYNTPPVFAIYISKLALDYTKEVGGIPAIEKVNRQKAKIIYDVIDASGGFYRGHARPDSRSLMNITFRLPSEELETKFADEAKKLGMIGLKGHRSVGGMRASLYNAVTVESAKVLGEFMTEFQAKNQ